MAYNEILSERVRELISTKEGYSERKMFGGVCFMINGNMACGVIDDRLMLRVGPEKAEELLKEDGVREMDFTGRPMKGMVFIEHEQTKGDEDLARWVAISSEFAHSLPPKQE